MTPAFYMDVHVPRSVTVALRMRGIDVLTAQEDRAAQLDDAELLSRATNLRRILVSQDVDLVRVAVGLQRTGLYFSGVIYGHQLRTSIGKLVHDLELLARATEFEEWQGRIEYLPLD